MNVLESWARGAVGEWPTFAEAALSNERLVESTDALLANRMGAVDGLVTQLELGAQ